MDFNHKKHFHDDFLCRCMTLCRSHHMVVSVFLIGLFVGFFIFHLNGLVIYVKPSALNQKDIIIQQMTTNMTITIARRYSELHHNHSACSNNASVSQVDPIWLTFRWHEHPPNYILYNRVPKTGSSVTSSVLKALSLQNKFHLVSSPIDMLKKMPIPNQEDLVQRILRQKKPLLYVRHACFIDFERFGYSQPMYINTIREPISWFISHYYYARKMSASKYIYTEEQRQMTLDQCLNKSIYNCETTRQLNYFCGQDKICNSPDPPLEALQLAKRNIEQHYAVVGVNEDLLGFFQILETLVPTYFKGGAAAYIKHKEDKRHFTSKRFQLPPQPSTTELLGKLLKYDIELYKFAQQRLHKQKCIADYMVRKDSSAKSKPKSRKEESGRKI